MISFKLFLEQTDIEEHEHDGAVVHNFNVGPHKVQVTHFMNNSKKGTFIDTDFEVNGKTMKDPSNNISHSHAVRILSGVGQSIAKMKEKYKEPNKPMQFELYVNTEQKERLYKNEGERLARKFGGSSRHNSKTLTTYLKFKE